MPAFWSISLMSFPYFRQYIRTSDMPHLQHIQSISVRFRPRFSDGFFISIQLDTSFMNATLIRSFALHNNNHVLSVLLRDKSRSKESNSLEDSLKTIKPVQLITTNLVDFSLGSADNQTPSSGNTETTPVHHTEEVTQRIRECGFFSYFLSDMTLESAEILIKQFLPKVVHYYLLGIKHKE